MFNFVPTPIKTLLQRALLHQKFFRQHGVVKKREIIICLSLVFFTVLSETISIGMIWPIVEFLEKGSDVAAFQKSSEIANILVISFNTIGMHFSLLHLMMVSFFFICLRQAINFSSSIFSDHLKWQIGRRLGLQVFASILSSRASTIETFNRGEFTMVVDHESQAAATVINGYLRLWEISISMIIYSGILLITAPFVALGVLVTISSILFCLGFLVKKTNVAATKSIMARKSTVDFLSQRFGLWREIKLNSAVSLESKNLDSLLSKVVHLRRNITKYSLQLNLFYLPIVSLIFFSSLYIFVEILELSIASIVLFMMIMLRLIPIGQNYQGTIARLASHDPSLEKLDKVLKTTILDFEHLNKGLAIKSIKSGISFENVTFNYDNEREPAINNISFHIPAGTFTAIIGPSGSGKTTLIELLAGIRQPEEGKILFDGMNSKSLRLGHIRSLVAYVGQEPAIFDTDLVSNLGYPNSGLKSNDIQKSLRLTNMDEFVNSLPNKLMTKVGEDGSRLSVGQRQRIGISRAFLSAAQIIILDEPTSSLDSLSEKVVKDSIESMVKDYGKTVIMIAHRLTTIENAELVLKLKNGKLVN